MEIGELLKIEVKHAGFSQKEFSQLIGKSETAVCQIFKGTYNANPATLKKMCKVLKIEIQYKILRKV